MSLRFNESLTWNIHSWFKLEKNSDSSIVTNHKEKSLLISLFPCQFGQGWASSHCQSAIWSPLRADSCKATHVRVTHTRWCCEDRGTERVSVLDCLVERTIPISSKHTYQGSHPPVCLSSASSLMQKLKKQHILTTAYAKLAYNTVPVQIFILLLHVKFDKLKNSSLPGVREKKNKCWLLMNM